MYAKLGEIYERLGRTDEAYAYMKKAVSTQQTLSVPRK